MTLALVTLPDVEQLCIQALLTFDELEPLGGRIYSTVPKQRTFPLARVYRYGGDPLFNGDPYWLDNAAIQVDVWGTRIVEAQFLAETVRACLSQRLPGSWPTGVVNAVRVSALVHDADAVFNPPQPRYRFSAQVMSHPLRNTPTPRMPLGAQTRQDSPAVAGTTEDVPRWEEGETWH
jgi:hypothetical protein